MSEIHNYVSLLERLLESVECIIDFSYSNANIYNWYNNTNYFNYLITNREKYKGRSFFRYETCKTPSRCIELAINGRLLEWLILHFYFEVHNSSHKSSQCLSQGHTVFWSNPFTLAKAISILCSSKFVRGDNAFVCSWCFALRKRLPWKIHFHPNKMYIMHILQVSIVMKFFHIDEKSNVKWKF